MADTLVGAVPSPDSTRPLRGAVLGLGMIGRHHARLLQASPRVAFAGAVDPAGDRFGAVHDPALVFGRPRRAAARRAAGLRGRRGAHRGARRRGERARRRRASTCSSRSRWPPPRPRRRALIDACAAAGVHGAVGHVERFNPALLELRRRVAGRASSARSSSSPPSASARSPTACATSASSRTSRPTTSTSCAGSAARPSSASPPQTQHRMGREHEDLVLATGRLESGDQLQLRRRLALADEGAPHAGPRRARHARGRHADRRPDLLRATARSTSEWAATQSLRGVSRGRHDALRAGAPRAAAGRARGVLRPARGRRRRRRVVTLAEGLETVLRAPRPSLASAAARRDGRRRGRRVRAVVVALGKIGLPLAAQIARAGHEVVGCDIDARVGRRSSTPAQPPFPGEAGPGRGAGRGRRRRAPARARPTRPRPSPRAPDLVVAVPPLVVDADARPDWAHRSTRSSPTSAPGCRPGTTVAVETTLPGRHDARPRSRPRWRPPAACAPRTSSSAVFSPERVYSGRVFARPRDLPQARRRAQRGRRGARRRALPRVPRRRGLADGLAPRRPS